MFRHEWAAKEKLKEQESVAAAAAAAAAEEAALEEAEMNAPAGVHFGTLPATRAAAGATADPSGTVAGDLSTSAAGLQKVGLTFHHVSKEAPHSRSTSSSGFGCTADLLDLFATCSQACNHDDIGVGAGGAHWASHILREENQRVNLRCVITDDQAAHQ